jgi:hypothetical protein
MRCVQKMKACATLSPRNSTSEYSLHVRELLVKICTVLGSYTVLRAIAKAYTYYGSKVCGQTTPWSGTRTRRGSRTTEPRIPGGVSRAPSVTCVGYEHHCLPAVRIGWVVQVDPPAELAITRRRDGGAAVASISCVLGFAMPRIAVRPVALQTNETHTAPISARATAGYASRRTRARPRGNPPTRSRRDEARSARARRLGAARRARRPQR